MDNTNPRPEERPHDGADPDDAAYAGPVVSSTEDDAPSWADLGPPLPAENVPSVDSSPPFEDPLPEHEQVDWTDHEPSVPGYDAPPSQQADRRTGSFVAAIFLAGVFGAAVLAAILYFAGVFDDDPLPAPVASPPTTIIEVREIITESNLPPPAPSVARKVVPSIVTVEIGNGQGGDNFDPVASGSGVVLSDDGLIVTNHHVIDGTGIARVIFQDGRIYQAEVVGSDPLTDLAVLKIEASGLIEIEKGTTDGVVIGDVAIAVGNPLGLRGGASLTVGVLSAFNRDVTVGPSDTLYGMLQTDAPITEGSSGGALVDGNGNLIGITTAIGVSSSGAEGIGFAIPIELVNRITDEIIETGGVRHAFLGVNLADSLEAQPDGSRIPVGALISGLADGNSAAGKAGIEPGDVIVRYDDVPVRTADDLIIGIRQYHVGEEIELEVLRGNETFIAQVELGERSSP